MVGGPEEINRRFYDSGIRSLFEQIGRDNESEATLSKLNEIIDLASTALSIIQDQSISDSAFHSHRGLAYFKKYNYRRHKDRLNLEKAIVDFNSTIEPRPNDRSFIQALLAQSYLLKNSDPAEGLVVLRQALEIARNLPNRSAHEKLEQQINLNIADSLLRIAIKSGDVATMKAQCEKILSQGESSNWFLFPLAYAAKAMLNSSPDEDAFKLSAKIMQKLDAVAQQAHLDKKIVADLSSHAASISLALGNEFTEASLQQNIRVATASPEGMTGFRCSIIGRLALDVGKGRLRAGDVSSATDHFQDAIDWLRKGLEIAQGPIGEKNPLFDIVVTHCSLGEAFLRMQSIVGGANLGRQSLRQFKKALSIGSPPSEVLSLMGDAHFRIGRYLRDTEHLKSAIEFKKKILNSKPTREAWSICSAALGLLYTLEGDSDFLAQAVDACIEAHDLDPKWPWPFFQLANIFEAHDVAPDIIAKGCSHLLEDGVDARDVPLKLKERAVDLTIENTEFGRAVLGGRTRVFVLSDQHKLISSSIVLKPTTIGQAYREKAVALEFGQYLRTLGLDSSFGLPKPISIRKISAAKCIYAMERAEGQTLADGLISLVAAGKNAEVISYFERALEFLATYHAWKLVDQGGAPNFGNLKREISELIDLMGLDPSLNERIMGLADECFLSTVPLVAKKDAHPENWIITPSSLVMLDLESAGVRPACYEVAQLLDDYGLVEVSEKGMEVRISLAHSYINRMKKLGAAITIEDSSIENTYAFYWALRCGFGIGYCRRHTHNQSSAAQKRLTERQRHFMTSLQFLRGRYKDAPVGALASLIDTH